MLVDSARLGQCPVLSLHVGGAIAFVESVIIDASKMQIVGFFLSGPVIRGEIGNILETKMVREFSPVGMIVDSEDDFTSPGEVVKLDKVIKNGFSIEGINVVTKKGTKLGKVTSFIFDPTDYKIMQIVVKRPIMKALIDPELIISRKEIVNITNDKIVVKDEEDTLKDRMVREDFVPNFVNPFRENGAFSTESAGMSKKS